MEKTINKNDTRLRIFSGTANPALSQVNMFVFTISFTCLLLESIAEANPLCWNILKAGRGPPYYH